MNAYLLTLTGAADGVADALIGMESFSYRQKNGSESRLSIVVPYAYADEFDARPSGELIINQYQDGALVEELARANLTGVPSGEGALNRSLQVEGTKQTTWTPPDDPTVISRIIYRGTNQSDGRWTYRLAAPIAGLKAGWAVTYGSHTFTVGEVLHQVNADSHTVHLSEAVTSAAGDTGDAACWAMVTIPETVAGSFDPACFYSGDSRYHNSHSFTLNTQARVSCAHTGALYDVYLTHGLGLTAFDETGEAVDRPIVYGAGFVATLPAGDYNVQVRSSDDAATYTLAFSFQ